MKKLLTQQVSLVMTAALATGLAGCNVGPKYTRPTYPAPPAFRGADDQAVSSNGQGSLGDEKWTSVFQEPELQNLIRTALANNYDLQVAAARVMEQEAQVRITRAQQFPQITAGGSGAGIEIPSSSYGSSIDSPLSFGGFNLGVSWIPDFWGLYRKQTAAARAQLLEQEWAKRAVRMTIIQNVATAYLQLRALDRQLEVTKETLKVRQESLKLTETLANGGSAPLSDVRQSEQLLYTATSQIPQLEQQIQQQENALQVLLAQNPGPLMHQAPDALAPPPQNLPVGLPSQLLERRPDIQEAEQELVAANAQVGVARAQFFPQLNITASAGIGGDSFPAIFDSDSTTVYGLGSLTQPIFMGGKLRGQLQLSEEKKKELIYTYKKTINGALRDVSNALIANNKQRLYRQEQEKLVAAAQDATRLARMRYKAGSTSYLEVLTTDSNLYSAQLNLVSAQQQEALTLVQLYASLGGGWQE